MMITTHFSDYEFMCPHCGNTQIKHDFVKHLEELYMLLDSAIGIKSIIINSGYRCATHSLAVGGFTDDCHVLGFGADIHVNGNDGKKLSAYDIAEGAELLGFAGIGIISTTDCHIDDRGIYPYKNNHWFGNEQTGELYTTFKGGSKYSAILQKLVSEKNNNQNTINCILEINNKKYTGLLEEME